MAAEPAFVAWLHGVREAVDAVRASATQVGGSDSKRDKRLDSVLPMQFEHGGRLHWAHAAHGASMWSAIFELGIYLCGLLGILFLLLAKWIAPWAWIGLGVGFALVWILHRYYRRLEQPAQQWRQEAEVVPGVLVYANEVLYAPGPEPASNAGFVITFDAGLAADPERLQAVARRCFDLHQPSTSASSDERELQRRCIGWSEERTPDHPHVFDRVPVPRSLCGNDATYFTLVAVARQSLVGGVIDRSLYPLLARRDRNESAELVPPSFHDAAPRDQAAG